MGAAFEGDGFLAAAGHQSHGDVVLLAVSNQVFRGRHRFSLRQKLFHDRLLNRQQSLAAD